MKNIKRFMLPAALASVLMLAACGSDEDAAEVEAETEEVAEVEEEETEVETVEEEEVEEEEAPNPYNEYDQEVGIFPEEDADIEGSDDMYAAAKIAEAMADEEMASRLKAYERLIRPLDTDEHTAFTAQAAYDAVELGDGVTWTLAAMAYIDTHHPDLDPVDDRDEIREILRDPEQGAFRIGTANTAIQRMMPKY